MFNSNQQFVTIFVFSLLFTITNHTEAAVFSYQASTPKEKVLNLTRNKPLKFAKNKITFKKNDKVKVKLKNGKKVRGKIRQINSNSIIIIHKGKEVSVPIENLKYIRFFDSGDYAIMSGIFFWCALCRCFNTYSYCSYSISDIYFTHCISYINLYLYIRICP